jgi:pyruvate kinase
MVARGDLGVEIEIESVPIVQKKIIEQANKVGKPVITATQMLKSMVESPIPTRAEVTDVANAIFEGTDAIMLSEETAIGQFPVKAVEIMGKIAKKSETSTYFYREELKPQRNAETLIPDSISHSATILARDLDAAVIFAVTRTGYTARSIAKFRPGSVILAMTPEETVYHQLQLVWGVLPVKYDLQQDQNTLFADAIKIAKKLNIGQKDQHYVFASGFPLGKPGSINQVNAGKIP